jgi:hypothetical protein
MLIIYRNMWSSNLFSCFELQCNDLLDCCYHDAKFKEIPTKVIQNCHLGERSPNKELIQYIKTSSLEPYYEWTFINKIIDDFSFACLKY